jgi:predicted GNAT family N-acyltransferase
LRITSFILTKTLYIQTPMNVKQIDAKDTYNIRNKILRSGLPIDSCYFEGDKEDSTFHLGAYIDDKLASIASFFLKTNPIFPEEYQFQLRGMATLKEYQGQGLSQALLRAAFPLIQQNHVNSLWCNARIPAVGFYEKVGFEVHGNEFDIPGVGPHVLMHKTI